MHTQRVQVHPRYLRALQRADHYEYNDSTL